MTDILGTVGVVLTLVFLAFMLRELGFRGGGLISCVGIVGLFMLSVKGIGYFFDGLSVGLPGAELGAIISSVLKVLGVGYLFGICADICRQIGEGGIASAVLMMGRVEILLLCLPYIRRIIELSGELVGS